MKFYIDKKGTNYFNHIIKKNITCIYSTYYNFIRVFANGYANNDKNAAVISNNHKEFFLNGIFYGNHLDFTKNSWRKFVKLKVFL